jgi:hypothetical protein
MNPGTLIQAIQARNRAYRNWFGFRKKRKRTQSNSFLLPSGPGYIAQGFKFQNLFLTVVRSIAQLLVPFFLGIDVEESGEDDGLHPRSVIELNASNPSEN